MLRLYARWHQDREQWEPVAYCSYHLPQDQLSSGLLQEVEFPRLYCEKCANAPPYDAPALEPILEVNYYDQFIPGIRLLGSGRPSWLRRFWRWLKPLL